MSTLPTFNKADYIFTPLFCEENIWLLCKSLVSQSIPEDELCVLFLSNTQKEIVLFNQIHVDPGLLLLYDYHVILKYRPDEQNTYIFDLDTRLSFPTDWNTYQKSTFPDSLKLPDDSKMMIREIPASEYLECFTSDRKHMAHLPISKHPQYDCIQSKSSDCKIELQEYWQMDEPIRGESIVYQYNP